MSEEEVSLNRMPLSSEAPARLGPLKVYVCPTTGGHIELHMPISETVNGLKWAISRKLRIPPERINLLFKNKILKDGSLLENQIFPDSKITLLPNMESGMTRPDAGVMQALENLSESQVNDFLSGRAPLLLAMRLGDHMMFVQLQLSTTQCMGRRSRGQNLPTMTTPQTSPTANVFPQTAISPASLAEASRNLSQKLRELSRLTGHTKVTESTPVTVSSRVPPPSSSAVPTACAPPSSSPGAVIESMHHLGQGVYSGTFSGTLDPTLQDNQGKPKRDISTIVHILNDLLGASPHYHCRHPCVHIRHPARKHQRPHTLGNCCEEVSGESSEDDALRGKVRQLQMMMEERRLRRKARREMKAPYQWNGRGGTNCTNYDPEENLKSEETSAAGSTMSEGNTMDLTENVEPSSYRKASLEQETVAV